MLWMGAHPFKIRQRKEKKKKPQEISHPLASGGFIRLSENQSGETGHQGADGDPAGEKLASPSAGPPVLSSPWRLSCLPCRVPTHPRPEAAAKGGAGAQ